MFCLSPLSNTADSTAPSPAGIVAAQDHVDSSPLEHSTRAILHAVIKRSPTAFFPHGVTHANSAQLTLLAMITRDALVAFRNTGGRPSSSASSVAVTPCETPSSESPPAVLASPGNNVASPPPNNNLDAILSLATAFGLDPNTLRPRELSSLPGSRRPHNFATDISQRTIVDECTITGIEIGLTSAHILPASLISPTTPPTYAQTVLWVFLAFFLGPTLYDSLWTTLLHGSGMNSSNGIRLSPSFHDYFDSGFLTLIPTSISEDETELKVRLAWHHKESTLMHLTSRGDGGVRPLVDGDVFMIKTMDKVMFPVPMVGYLQLHDSLWRVIGMCGLLAGGARGEVDGKEVKGAKDGSSRKRRKVLPNRPGRGAGSVPGPQPGASPGSTLPAFGPGPTSATAAKAPGNEPETTPELPQEKQSPASLARLSRSVSGSSDSSSSSSGSGVSKKALGDFDVSPPSSPPPALPRLKRKHVGLSLTLLRGTEDRAQDDGGVELSALPEDEDTPSTIHADLGVNNKESQQPRLWGSNWVNSLHNANPEISIDSGLQQQLRHELAVLVGGIFACDGEDESIVTVNGDDDDGSESNGGSDSGSEGGDGYEDGVGRKSDEGAFVGGARALAIDMELEEMLKAAVWALGAR